MSTTRRLLLVFAILFSCVACDQTTKAVAKTYLSETGTIVLLGDTVRLQLAKNYGAFLSLGASVGEASRGMLMSVVVGAVLAALLVYLFISKPQNPLVAVFCQLPLQVSWQGQWPSMKNKQSDPMCIRQLTPSPEAL
jgi:signal peptidase II